MPNLVFRMSCIYGPHQCGTEDQGWVAHFLMQAIAGQQITLYGDGMQVRDVLYVDDLVDAMRLAQQNAGRLAGQAFNIGGGPRNVTSLVELVELIGELDGEPPLVRFDDWRVGDQRYYVSDTRAFRIGDRMEATNRCSGGSEPPPSVAYPQQCDRPRNCPSRCRVKFALINPNWSFDGSIYFGCREPHLPLEYGYAKALLEKEGHEVRIIDGQLEQLEISDIYDRVADFRPDFTVVTTAPSYLFWRCAPPELRVPQQVVRSLRSVGGKMVGIGPHCSTTPKTTLRKLGVHAVVLGECEDILPQLSRPW